LQDCALCLPTPHEILWQDDFCRVVLLNDSDYPAYCRVELIAHIKEMTDLQPDERARMMKTVFMVETAIREVVQPDKINLASLGNKTPHVHWHIVPRFSDDKHFPNSHWGEAVRDGLQANIHGLSEASKNALKGKVKTYVERALAG
jgi:diadenosine tetraphosphate (Ap4A) HIT family hydrolase